MAKRYTRRELLDRLWSRINAGYPIVMASAGNGIAAKFLELGGTDILGVYNTGYFRMQGYGSLAGMLPMADANELVFEMGRRDVLPDMQVFLEDCKRLGFSGVHNFPTVAWFEGEFRRTLESTGLGYGLEVTMLNMARQLDMLTVGYAFNESDTKMLMTEAAPDIFILHAGITQGGSTGYSAGRSLEQMARLSQSNYEIAKKIKPDVILLAHGAALVDPADGQYMLDHSDCHGIQLGSSIERLAIEKPLEERSASFKSLRFSEGRPTRMMNRTGR